VSDVAPSDAASSHASKPAQRRTGAPTWILPCETMDYYCYLSALPQRGKGYKDLSTRHVNLQH
jgi:hypothetical protein